MIIALPLYMKRLITTYTVGENIRELGIVLNDLQGAGGHIVVVASILSLSCIHHQRIKQTPPVAP